MVDMPMATAHVSEADALIGGLTGIHALLEPDVIAVIGVSRHRRGLGRRIYEALLAAGFPGRVFAVTRDGSTVDGQPSWTSVRALPGRVDLAVIAVPRDMVTSVIDDCIASAVRAVVLITAGFAETDTAGRALQDDIVAKVRAAGIRMVGPNCMGVINASASRPMNASFSPRFPPAGGLAMSSQSGALGVVILDLATRRHVGISTFVSVGNRADVSGNDLLQYWAEDPATSVIALYMESFGNPRHFAQIARAVARTKPIIAVKSGRTRAGAIAAGSHTAALAASDVAAAALFHQSGVIRADTIDELFDLAACLEAQPLPHGTRVAIVTNAGGPGILAADACAAAGLTVVTFSAATRTRLAAALPGPIVPANPLDMIATAGPDQYRAAIAAVLEADDVDALLVLFTPVDLTIAAPIVDAIRDGIAAGRGLGAPTKPVLACLMGDEGHPQLTTGVEQIPVYAFPENAARALGKIARYAAWRSTPPAGTRVFRDLNPSRARALCRSILDARGPDWLTSEETSRLLASYGLVLTPAVPVRSTGDAVRTACAMGFPVVAKLSSRYALHKTDVGGVAINLRTAAEVGAAFERLTRAASTKGLEYDSVLIQPMVADGIETMVGIVSDPLFGSLVGFGLGGVEVEAFDDIRFRVTPLR
jgi:acyl-CoA synthetase (NDP forming)